MNQVYKIMLKQGWWGDQTRMMQRIINLLEGREFSCKVEEIMWQQDKIISTRSIQEVLGQYHFSGISEIAVHLCVLVVPSANGERVYKAHTVIHIKAQNRLKVRSVNILLFHYVNLQLLNKDNTKVGIFLEDIILNEEIKEVMAEKMT